MGFQGNGVTMLNFDGTYRPQKRLFRFPHEWIDLSDVPETNLYCSGEALAEIERRLRRRRMRGAVLIGNGNFHYVSYLLIKEMKEPFTLVLFDHHTDAEGGATASFHAARGSLTHSDIRSCKKSSLLVRHVLQAIFVYLQRLQFFLSMITMNGRRRFWTLFRPGASISALIKMRCAAKTP